MADIRITGRMVNFSRLTFDTNDHNAIRQQLSSTLNEGSYVGTLVIIDSTVEQELIALIQLLIDLGLQPMAVIDGILGDEARAIQFPVLPADQPLQRIKASKEQVVDHAPVKTADNAAIQTPQKNTSNAYITSYHDEILRTGQCLVQDQGDIILNAGMNSGSEVIASGNIHIYGNARGRVIAGAGGQAAARIFCHSLEAELISIAGTYCVADDIPKDMIKKPVHIYLNNKQELEFEALQF
ncbi:putative septum site-determining protein MinC [Acinetobacter gyllenbergii]|jgi:septum site-determining protein MinC|uniref:Probable septum site-determining protein MinC n=2 Tax=Acinetobacter TaxID=469 RepID=A0A653K4B4_9GAMM|nr:MULTISPECIES: septum site-determining protein MinC [Acinetobacter]ENU23006.1 septum site-determining protein MinC [Acinetobacter proteolyticus]EPF69576.1 septum site-determining protein MinC [Acinetobacter gyllenbergii CIP 110306 = MTCC 11365]EPH33103.1 Septum site-determining protein MinC [Acinetobacter gyllenbergii CIP 110306 = MTCC 11365]MCH7303108.1 septum site-determining protein MinC [Acinetobacter higginsii]MCU4581232.1 septum site-determining protein MinC [Acinetobacter gyllenbergii